MIDLIKGDCLEEMKNIADNSIDAIICDLPYGTTACKWDSVIPFEPLWEQYKRIIKYNGAIVLFGSQPFTTALISSNYEMFKYEWVWEKTRASNMFFRKTQPLKYHENILVFSKASAHNMAKIKINYNPIMQERDKKNIRKQKTYKTKGNTIFGNNREFINYKENDRRSSNNIYPKSIIKVSSMSNFKSKRVHPTQKPLELLEYLVKTYSLENDTILDNTMGSGTTMVACKNLNRNGIGIEMDENYFNITQQRLA